MNIAVHPNLARIATREGLLIPFVIWSSLRVAAIQKNLTSEPLKSQAKKLLRSWGLTYTDRHYQRIWNSGLGIFWGLSEKRVYLRSFRRVSEKIATMERACDNGWQNVVDFQEIEISKSLQAFEAQVYLAWFRSKGETTISRATLQDLFGYSPDTQRQIESRLSTSLQVSYHYAHIDLQHYKRFPREIPAHHFTIEFERDVLLDGNIKKESYIQYQLPNGYRACPDKNSDSDGVRASNRARYALNRLLSRRSLVVTPIRRYYLQWSKFERFGGDNDYIRAYFQGRKKLFLLGHYL